MSQRAFSIVVPVHNVRAYLRECLDSILGQSFTDFELIAVDDASPDGSGEILDEYASADARVSVLHLEHNVGLGPARDAGVDVATGRYLLFVDSDDSLTPGSLQAIADRIGETGEPEIVVFDYARTYWTGAVERNTLGKLFAADVPDVFDVEQRPEFLRLLMVVWNKAYRLDFVREHGFRFPAGYYEDLPWTFPTMLTARRITTLDRVCYHYRQRRHGSILRTANRRQFEVFGQYQRVFDYLDAHAELARWQAFMFTRMVDHLLWIIVNGNRIAPSMRREFFDAIVEAFYRHRPPNPTLPSGRVGTFARMVERRDYRTFATALVAMRTRQAARRRVRGARRILHNRGDHAARRLAVAYYWLVRRRPVDQNLAVYQAYGARNYACNPAAIYEAARRLAPQVKGGWVIRREYVHRIPTGVDYVIRNSRAHLELLARAKYFVSNVDFPDYVVKRPGTVHVQTQHGTPLKTMGLALQEHPAAEQPNSFAKLLQNCDRWDYLVSSNRFSTEVWERCFPSEYITLESGYPRNDRLVRATLADAAHLRSALDIPADRTVLLYAPTFRDWDRGRFVSPIDLADLCERLGERYVVLVRGHYTTEYDGRLGRMQDLGLLRDVSDQQSIEDLMIASDALITDYSSVMFDYANLDRPIVIFAPDWETYRRIRGVNFDLFAAPPGVVETTQDGLVDAFLSGRYCDARAETLRKEFARRFCELDDGYAAERVVREVFLGEHDAHAQRATGTAQGDVGPENDDDPAEPEHADRAARKSDDADVA